MSKGYTMSHSKRAVTHKYPKHPKTNFQQYLYNSSEPNDDLKFADASARLQRQTERYYSIIRKRIRRNAQKLRIN